MKKYFKKRTPLCPHSLLQRRPLCQFLVCILRTRRRSDNREALESPPSPPPPPPPSPHSIQMLVTCLGAFRPHTATDRVSHIGSRSTHGKKGRVCALCVFFLSFSFPSSLLPPIPRRRRLKGSAGLSGCFPRERERERPCACWRDGTGSMAAVSFNVSCP